MYLNNTHIHAYIHCIHITYKDMFIHINIQTHTYIEPYMPIYVWMYVIYMSLIKSVVTTITICIPYKWQYLIFSYTPEQIWLPHS